jgi:hypothetical protein
MHQLAHDAGHDRRAESAAEEVAAQAAGGAVSSHPAQGGQPPPRDDPRALELAARVEGAQGRRDERGRHAAGAQLGDQSGRAVAPRCAGFHPLAGEARVVEVAARREIRDDLLGQIGRRAAAAQPRRQLRARPRAPREEISSGEAGGRGVEGAPRSYDLRSGRRSLT